MFRRVLNGMAVAGLAAALLAGTAAVQTASADFTSDLNAALASGNPSQFQDAVIALGKANPDKGTEIGQALGGVIDEDQAASVAGAIAGAAVLYAIASGKADFSLAAGFASNGYGEHSPGGYSLGAALVCEVVMTFMFLIVILGATHTRAPVGFAGLAIGVALALIHLISIPVTNTSVNPARSTGPALFVGGWATAQLWLFWAAPLAGAFAAGVVYRGLLEGWVAEPPVTGRVEPEPSRART